jgi:hypothetical protein
MNQFEMPAPDFSVTSLLMRWAIFSVRIAFLRGAGCQ